MSRSKKLLSLILVAVAIAAAVAWWLNSGDEPAPAVEDTSTTETTETSGELVVPDGADIAIAISGEANGVVAIDLFEDIAPQHAERIKTLAAAGAYDNVVFHRVIEGFMAQTGDVEFGKVGGDMRRAGMGASQHPDLPAEFSDKPFDRGIVGMARSQNPNSANSQFFIMFAPGHFLNGQYTVVGKVVAGMEVVDAIKLGKGPNGAVIGQPDVMQKLIVAE
ncbi:peptidylprolyl isomerase [Shimia sediminis]|uniref:peptidylprolyl isomerase n=1 Tax=Shimia sediminis TaxID=2497945 RepID=UPI000F8E3542|nr:peptidylprolyl isomerase [Shimia sediminis]